MLCRPAYGGKTYSSGPAARGEGTRIFENQHDLHMIEGTSFDNGVVMLRYAINT